MFAPASDLSPNEIRAYRKFAFPEALGKPGHDPFFSVDVAATWISSFGYQLYLEHDDSVTPTTLWNPGNAAVKALTGYQSYILADAYLTHPFFSLENLENWVSGVAFQAYMDTIYGKHRGRRNESSPLSSRAPSRAASAAESRPGSRMSFVPSSRASSPMSYPASDFPSRPSSSMSVDYTVDIQNDKSLDVSSPAVANPSDSSLLPTPLEYINAPELKITRQHPVDRVTMCTVVPSTFVVPRDSAAYLVDLSDSVELLTTSTGKILPLDAFIRAENQESWKGSGGHAKGDVNVSGFDRDFERFEPDEQAMQELWNHELDANELEASSAPRILSRFYNRIQASKCKTKCDGVPILVPLSHPSAYGKRFFVDCSKWSRAEMYLHVYWPDGEIKSLQDQMTLDRHRTDLKEQVNELRKDIEEEKSARREWTLRRQQIDARLTELKKGGLAGVRLNGGRARERPLEESTPIPSPDVQGGESSDLVEPDLNDETNAGDALHLSNPGNLPVEGELGLNPEFTDAQVSYELEYGEIGTLPGDPGFSLAAGAYITSPQSPPPNSAPETPVEHYTDVDFGTEDFLAEFLTMGDVEMTEYLANLDFGGTTYDLPTLPPPPILSPALPSIPLPAQGVTAEVVQPTRKRKAKDPEPNECVAVKRMYVRRAKPTETNANGWVINRMMPADEYRKILMEANILLWAGSIMAFTYSFIDHFIENSPDPPPFEIPDIRFVHAGVVLVHQQLNGPLAPISSSICRSYLVEELIDEQEDGFHKFINNGSATPLPSTDASVSAMAEFLSFTQHVQHHKTKGMLYLSDLQGTTQLLTDLR
ncbi:hypothetical protein C8R46DRAFT_1351910, partial [Mycena filopes]